jgi:cobalt-zinc-cadmium efflux system outer membrane protein
MTVAGRVVSIATRTFKMKLTLTILAIALIAGCAVTPPGHDTARQIQSAASLANAIQFHTTALPVEAAPAADRLTIPLALERALRQSPEVQVALAHVRAAQAEAHQARLLPNPVLDIAFRFPEGGGRTIIEAGLAAELVKLLQRPRRISARDAVLRAASAKAVTATLEVMHETQRHYFDAVGLRRETEILTERNSRIGELLRVAEARLAAGEGTQLDVATLKAEQATAAIDLRDATLKLRQVNLALAHRLGQPRGRIDWQLATPLYTQIALSGEPDSIAHGLRVRPEIQADRWQLAALEDQTALARLAWMEGATAGLDTERDSDWSLGPSLALPLPIFDWGQARRAKARAQAIAARQRLTQTTRQVAREIRQAHASVIQLMTTARQARTTLVPLHEERVRLARAIFDAGQEDVTRLRLAELDLLDAQLKLARLEHRTAQAIIALDRATGGSTEGKAQ